MRALADISRGLDLGLPAAWPRREGTGGRDKSRSWPTRSAIIGAVYVQRGLVDASVLVHRLFDPLIEASAQLGAGLDWKTSLQELTAAAGLGVPGVRGDRDGPDHMKMFTAAARVGGSTYGDGSGRSKKEAEQQAAEAAWTALRNIIEANPDGSPDAGTR
jgi:ribonuclease-3